MRVKRLYIVNVFHAQFFQEIGIMPRQGFFKTVVKFVMFFHGKDWYWLSHKYSKSYTNIQYMIAPEQREKIRTVLGYGYANKVKEVLAERGIRNSEGNEHDTAMISHVFTGRRDNEVIEDAILTAYKRATGEDTKKPEAATSGN